MIPLTQFIKFSKYNKKISCYGYRGRNNCDTRYYRDNFKKSNFQMKNK